MTSRHLVLVAVLAFVPSMSAVAEQADTPKLEVQRTETMAMLLQKQVGKRVTVRLQAGEEITGTVRMVGEHVVHLSDLAGRDFYDAVVALDDISAMIVRVRGGS